ncbi:DUF2157 domain-containing protein [Alteromonas sp. 1_MG-2023]|uniref:DUF2157 domain-containing protein n=1 Tax=Alteromonas sp. 1_MG-2023 TaxID=3062669 RepID=UPI0026E3B99C|nr:DUF2157 domain-containing protein [Alteromonas sp. 1_MG-2023]MDO6568846.1 DUF2157 domain-containing protein [Alteromonas sp. 1_MG-2023]
MIVTKQNLEDAVSANILSSAQKEQLIAFLNEQTSTTAKFDFTHVLYYLGGLIAIGAMTLFMNLGWVSFGGIGIVFICLLYAAIGLKLTNVFGAKNLFVPAGLCATFVVALTPLAVYGLQHALGVWPDNSAYQDYHRYIEWHWLYMELGTLAVGVVVAWKYKYPFLVMPIAVTLWYLSMDVSVMLSDGDYSWELRKLVSMYTGLLMIALAFWVDIRATNKADYSFWIYLFGVISFWCGLSLQNSDNELDKFFYFLINLIMIFIGVLIVRRVFVVFGALGCSGYVGYLAFNVFADSWLFPIVLTALGFFVIFLGVQWQKHEAAITVNTRKVLPKPLQDLLASKHL